MTIADAITAFAAVVAALAFLVGIAAWRREFVGKRRIDLAEDALAAGYELQDFLSGVRSPFAFGSEGTSRLRADGESPEDRVALDKAYVAIERLKRGEPLLSRFRAMKYRFMAAFGPTAKEPFERLHHVVAQIQVSAHQLGSHYWQRERGREDGDESDRHAAERKRHEGVFWALGNADDTIDQSIRAAILLLEKFAMSANRR